MKPRMSFFVTRPPRAGAGDGVGSTPCSDAIRATTGETNALPFRSRPRGRGLRRLPGCRRGPAAARLRLRGRAARGAASGSGAGASGSAAAALAAGAPPIWPSFVPTSTVSPSCTRICVTRPAAGLGTSVSTLSVEISSSGSSASTCSPSCLSHFVIVPSETDTPIWGITTSTAVSVAIRSS